LHQNNQGRLREQKVADSDGGEGIFFLGEEKKDHYDTHSERGKKKGVKERGGFLLSLEEGTRIYGKK